MYFLKLWQLQGPHALSTSLTTKKLPHHRIVLLELLKIPQLRATSTTPVFSRRRRSFDTHPLFCSSVDERIWGGGGFRSRGYFHVGYRKEAKYILLSSICFDPQHGQAKYCWRGGPFGVDPLGGGGGKTECQQKYMEELAVCRLDAMSNAYLFR